MENLLSNALFLTLFGMLFVFVFLALTVVLTTIMSQIIQKISPNLAVVGNIGSSVNNIDKNTKIIIEKAIRAHIGD